MPDIKHYVDGIGRMITLEDNGDGTFSPVVVTKAKNQSVLEVISSQVGVSVPANSYVQIANQTDISKYDQFIFNLVRHTADTLCHAIVTPQFADNSVANVALTSATNHTSVEMKIELTDTNKHSITTGRVNVESMKVRIRIYNNTAAAKLVSYEFLGVK